MKNLFLALALVSPTIMPPIPSRDVYHNYSVMVKADGGANAFLVVEGASGGEYQLTLPRFHRGEVNAWYADNRTFWPRTWKKIDGIIEEGDFVKFVIPKGNVSLGVTWQIADVTQKTWWGRRVTIETPTVNYFIPYVNVSVDFPDGVYVRDKAVGPANWGDMTAGVTMSQSGVGFDEKGAFAPEMFDRIAGTGDIVKSKNNLAPGESYEFTLLSATSRWKLFIPELATMGGGAFLLIVVTSFLLRLIVGRRPLLWYLSVVTLLVVLVALTLWLVSIYRTVFSSGGGGPYPVMMKAESVPLSP